jgi:vanadium chloroperoxidase
MIEENGRSRVYLGVHWVFDAFVVTEDDELDLYRKDQEGEEGKPFGGVPLGLLIAEDIFKFGNEKAPKKSTIEPRPEPTAEGEERTPTFASIYQPSASPSGHR